MSKKCWFHNWELRDSGGYYGIINFYVCKKCNMVKRVKSLYGRSFVDYFTFPLAEITMGVFVHDMCHVCGSINVYYSPEFSYDEKYKIDRVAGICECLDCGASRSVT